MQNIISANSKIMTMSSRDIAELIGKQHSNIKISAERLAESGVIGTLAPQEFKHNGNSYTEYLLNKRDSLILVAQNCPEFTAVIVDRWQELEEIAAKPMHLIPQTLSEALRLAADLSDQKAVAEAALSIAAPKANALDRIATADGSLCLTDSAKELQMRPKDLIAWMSCNQWIYKRAGSANWIGYQDRIQSNLLEHKANIIIDAEGRERVRDQVRITAKGLTRLAQIIQAEAA